MVQSSTQDQARRLDWADELAAAADRLSDEIQALDHLFAARLSDTGMMDIQGVLPDVRRRLNYLVAVLACRHARLGYPERTIELALQQYQP